MPTETMAKNPCLQGCADAQQRSSAGRFSPLMALSENLVPAERNQRPRFNGRQGSSAQTHPHQISLRAASRISSCRQNPKARDLSWAIARQELPPSAPTLPMGASTKANIRRAAATAVTSISIKQRRSGQSGMDRLIKCAGNP